MDEFVNYCIGFSYVFLILHFIDTKLSTDQKIKGTKMIIFSDMKKLKQKVYDYILKVSKETNKINEEIEKMNKKIKENEETLRLSILKATELENKIQNMNKPNSFSCF